jgi:hypothetical protein
MSIRNLGPLAIAVLLSSGCAQMSAQTALTRYQLALDPITGTATQEDIVRRYGDPQEKRKVGVLEVWTYQISHGYRGVTSISPFAPYDGYGTAYGPEWGTARGTTDSREQYDLLTLRFRKDGALDSWRVYVQR